MKLEDMNINKFYNILCNLNDMESIFLERFHEEAYYDIPQTYHRFLENYFIANNHLTDIYYPAIDLKEADETDSLASIERLSEIQQIFADLDVNITKQFNFPCKTQHAGSCFECIYVMEGRAEFHLMDHMFTLQAGDFIFHAPEDPYALNAQQNSIVINLDMRKSYIFEAYPRLFSNCPAALRFFEQCFRQEATGNYLLFHTDNQDEFKEAVLRIFIEYLWGDHYRNEIIRANFEMFIGYLKRYQTGDIESIQKVSSVEKNYGEIMKYLMKNYREATLELAAQEIHFSKQYVARIVRQMTGNSFTHLVKGIRIAKVKEYLEETDLSLENIADLTGFSNTSYLWRTFKELTGSSPSEYRAQKQQG